MKLNTDITYIPNIEQLMSKNYDLEQVTEMWTSEIVESQAQTKKWLLRHAIGLALWYQEIEKRYKNKELLIDPVKFFKKWGEDSLGISSNLLNKRKRAGEFILKVKLNDHESGGNFSSLLPMSYMTLVELTVLSDTELKQAFKDGIIHPEITFQEIKDYKADLKEQAKRAERAESQEKKSQGEKARTKESILSFDYDASVPDWIIEKIEEMAFKGSIDVIKHKYTFKDPVDNDITWVCIRIGKLWTASEHIKAKKKQAPPRGEKSKDKERRMEVYEGAEFVQASKYIGLDYFNHIYSDEVLDWIEIGFRRAYHPDKGNHDAEVTQKMVEAIKYLREQSHAAKDYLKRKSNETSK